MLDRIIDEFFEFGEVHDRVEDAIGLPARHAEKGGVEIDILAAGELAIESCAELEQGSDPAACFDGAL